MTLLTGWGRTRPSRADVMGPMPVEALRRLVASRPPRGVLARGLGRSYGDAAQNAGGVVLAPSTESQIELDTVAGTVRASGSTSFTELLQAVVPAGYLLPVIPGTRHVSVGGAVAADVHGKNHHVDGTIARWLDEVELLDGTGAVHRLSAGDSSSAGFRATVGGMGLTGVVLSATIRLVPLRTGWLRVRACRHDDLDAVMHDLASTSAKYTVAWVDCTATGRHLGRGVVDHGDHVDDPAQVPHGDPALVYQPSTARRMPPVPIGLMPPAAARSFNTMWFRRASVEREGLADLPTFFHRLDAIEGWNRALGPRGFVQYQFVVPQARADAVRAVLDEVHRSGLAPFLGTLKRFGDGDGHELSFPLRGWSLAMDLPVTRALGGGVLDRLDDLVAEAGGRVYLAKDARLSRTAFDAMFGPLTRWRQTRARLDPHSIWRSDLGRRLGLCP